MFDNILVPANEHHPGNHTAKVRRTEFTVCVVLLYVIFRLNCMKATAYENAGIFYLITNVRYKIVRLYDGNEIPRMNSLYFVCGGGKTQMQYKCNIAQILTTCCIQKDHKWF